MGFMHVLGDGTLNPFEVFFQDANLGVPDPAKVAEEGIKDKGAVTPKDLIKPDLTVSALFGSIGEPFWMVRKLPVIDASTPVVVQKADIDVTGRQRLHFCFDSAILTSAARQSLRQMCTDYLPVFLNPQTQLVVVGHADSVGTAGYNLPLSRNRAENTVQAIRDILGNKFQVKHLAIPASELVARLGGKNQQPDPRFRRVDVFLNGHLVLTLGGPTAP
jgi:outer membrane protein OmpA-like peptidoglycan-associated protein